MRATSSPEARRRFLRIAGGAGVALASLGAMPRSLAQADPRVAEVLAGVTAVDLHSHAGGRIVNTRTASPFNVAERMKRGRFGVVSMAVVADRSVISSTGGRIAAFRQPRPGELYADTNGQFIVVLNMVRDQGFRLVRTPQDMPVPGSDTPGLILAAEGADFLEGRIERVKEAFDFGLRHLQLVHYRVNELGDIQTEPAVHNGLTEFGAAVVAECNRLGVIVDLAHASEATTLQATALAKAPMILSHTSLTRSGALERGRLIGTAHARAVAGTDGVIGVWPSGYVFSDMAAWVRGIRAMADVVGVDHVGIGTDMEGGIKELFDSYADYGRVVEALLAGGFSVPETAKIVGGNHARVFAKVAAAASG
jgi:membrane dipeptidase